MNLNQFKNLIRVVSKSEAFKIRDDYINRFIDVNKEHYKKYVATFQEYSDGICYTGYLWDCLKEPKIVDFQSIKALSHKLNEVFVLWDIHTKERIFIKDYWKFGKDEVLYLNFSLLLDNLVYLPEDIYIFDKSLNWTFILTHEEINGKRWCIQSGNI